MSVIILFQVMLSVECVRWYSVKKLKVNEGKYKITQAGTRNWFVVHQNVVSGWS